MKKAFVKCYIRGNNDFRPLPLRILMCSEEHAQFSWTFYFFSEKRKCDVGTNLQIYRTIK